MNVSGQFGRAGLMVRIATRPPRKLFAHWLALALISFLLAGGLLLAQGIAAGTAQGMGRLGADLMLVPKEGTVVNGAKLLGAIPAGSALPEGLESGIASMPGISRVAPHYVFSSAADSCCDMGDILLVGFDPSRDFTVLPWLRPGAGRPMDKGQVVAGARVLKAPGAALRFFNHTFTLAARLEKSGTATFDSALFIPLDGLAAMERSSKTGGKPLGVPWGRPSILLLRLEPSIEPRQMALTLEQRYPGIQAVTIAGPARDAVHLLEGLGRCRGPLAATAWFIALVAGGTFLFSSLRTRRASLGLLHSFGCGTGQLAIMFGMETLVLALAGMVAGGLAAFFSLSLSGRYLAMATGVPLLSGWTSPAASAISWSFPVFAVALSIEAALIVLFMLRSEPADLLRGA